METFYNHRGVRTGQRISPCFIELCNLIHKGFVVLKVQPGCGTDTLSRRETLESGGLRLDPIRIGHTFTGYFLYGQYMKPVTTVLFEALIVGILLVMLYALMSMYTKPLTAVFLSGAVFHLLCEVSGVNRWYAQTYFR